MAVPTRMVMGADRQVGRIRLIALFHRILVQRGVVVPLQMARAGEPLVARGAVVGLWPPRLVTFPRLIRQRWGFRRLLQQTAGHLMARHRLRARDNRGARMPGWFHPHVLPPYELTLIGEWRDAFHRAH